MMLKVTWRASKAPDEIASRASASSPLYPRVAHLAGIASAQEGLRRFAGAQDLRRAGVQKDEIQSLEVHSL